MSFTSNEESGGEASQESETTTQKKSALEILLGDIQVNHLSIPRK